MSERWEYKVLTVDHFLSVDSDLTIEEKLNRYGENRWELIGFFQRSYTSLGYPPKLDNDSIVFKRQVTEE
ncbi:MAG TPA: DUF4177 domain-containing protein [Tissierellales bacterium]|nr:DUF4177 domain-containing protein [Tissierellales bacterium]